MLTVGSVVTGGKGSVMGGGVWMIGGAGVVVVSLWVIGEAGDGDGSGAIGVSGVIGLVMGDNGAVVVSVVIIGDVSGGVEDGV